MLTVHLIQCDYSFYAPPTVPYTLIQFHFVRAPLFIFNAPLLFVSYARAQSTPQEVNSHTETLSYISVEEAEQPQKS